MKKIKEFFKDFYRRINWKFVLIIYVFLILITVFDTDGHSNWVGVTIGFCVLVLMAYFRSKYYLEPIQKEEREQKEKRKKEKEEQQKLYEIEDSEILKTFLTKYENHKYELQNMLFEFKKIEFKSERYKSGVDIKKITLND